METQQKNRLKNLVEVTKQAQEIRKQIQRSLTKDYQTRLIFNSSSEEYGMGWDRMIPKQAVRFSIANQYGQGEEYDNEETTMIFNIAIYAVIRDWEVEVSTQWGYTNDLQHNNVCNYKRLGGGSQYTMRIQAPS